MRHVPRKSLVQVASNFASQYVAPRQPAVLAGAASTWLPHVDKQWQTIISRLGDLPVTLSVTRADGCFGRVDEHTVEFAAQRPTTLQQAWSAVFLPERAGRSCYLFAGSEKEPEAELVRAVVGCVPDHDLQARGAPSQPFVAEESQPGTDSKAVLWLNGGGTTA